MTINQERNQGTSSARLTENGIVEEETITRATPGHPRVSWGAILAGAFLTLAMAWLMTLLGMAIGVSILDASEAAAMGAGFTIGTGLWMLLTALVAFFVGALLTARLARSADQMNGLLHGISLWSLTTVLMLVLSYWGIAGLFQAGASAVGSTISAAASTAQTGGQALTGSGRALAQAGDALAESKLADQVISVLKRHASEQVSEYAGSDVTRAQAQRTIEQIDADVLKTVSLHLITGDVQAAKNALAANTALSSADIDTIVDKSKADVKEMADEFQKKAEEVVEAASSYVQAALWATFVCALLALAVSIAGGWIGAASVHRENVLHKRRSVSA
ncbi:MAG: hypothetical protein R6V60_07585 [Desulfobacterales bacterium]